MLGLVAFAGGVLLMISHKKQIDRAYNQRLDRRKLKFEQRKFRRRSLASTMIASMGVLLVSLNWAHDPSAFAALISVILILLLAVMFLAFLDLMSVSLQAATDSDTEAQQEMVREYVRQREKLQARESETDSKE